MTDIVNCWIVCSLLAQIFLSSMPNKKPKCLRSFWNIGWLRNVSQRKTCLRLGTVQSNLEVTWCKCSWITYEFVWSVRTDGVWHLFHIVVWLLQFTQYGWVNILYCCHTYCSVFTFSSRNSVSIFNFLQL